MATKKNETVEETQVADQTKQEISLAEMQAELARMMAEAKAAKEEAQRMLEEAKKITAGQVTTAERAAEIEADRLRARSWWRSSCSRITVSTRMMCLSAVTARPLPSSAVSA